jgi:hypothetical protein
VNWLAYLCLRIGFYLVKRPWLMVVLIILLLLLLSQMKPGVPSSGTGAIKQH